MKSRHFLTKTSINISRKKKTSKDKKDTKQRNKFSAKKIFDRCSRSRQQKTTKETKPRKRKGIRHNPRMPFLRRGRGGRLWLFDPSLTLSLTHTLSPPSPFSSLPLSPAAQAWVELDSRRELGGRFSLKMKLNRWSRESDEEKSDRHQKAGCE